ncbi:MAG: ribonuclease H-like domain-containing protein [Chloroflexi bacterium]|nr:ribonuclease H-like domain-containing protein [Chloroflexota bacterium]
MPAKPSLADKLKSLGVRPASDLAPVSSPQGTPAKKAASGSSIDAVVDGRFVQTRLGETFVSEQVYASDYRHGSAPITVNAPLTMLSAWAQEPRFADLPLEAYAFLDTETSGLAGGTGTYAFLVGAARFVEGEFRLAQFFMRDPSEEPALLEGLADFLAPCGALVTFNGKAFDAPLLVTRYTLHSIPLPFKDYAHLDLLPLARRLWRDRLPSRALKYLEENVLNAPRTTEEVPGYEIPYLYFDYLRTGDANPLKGVFYHNAMDVVAMAALLRHTSTILHDPFSELVEHGLDEIALAKLFEALGTWDMAARLFERGLEMNLPEADFWQAIQRLSRLQKRRGDMETAVRLWEQAAGQGHVYAHVELAKYQEHTLRDYPSAMKWTESAMQLVAEQDLPRYVYNHWMEELGHRRERLQGKCAPKTEEH